ncbi:LacI family DNA-binding transcriptional regulator [Devosia nitrariae]|uniref:LacI family transcriptional regulator n=1 Tax=Devosia nitrariae TaxID=2071872 RepID=A0ABQ5W721_9HYPH|nr:LacI family DNA-binding transcriptional regulator [Devosia nitrariae]GLQ55880.1 LacI family transcriptional regulator [Devosia nitrariae]
MTLRRTTQKDVALRAGVSQAAVSMVLGGGNATSLPPETVQRIQNAARELGYVPNSLAQALKTRRTMTIACVVPDITNPFYPALIRGVQRIAQVEGYDVITLNTDGIAANEQHFLEWALRGRVDGVVGVFFTLRAADLKLLLDNSIAIVRIESSRKAGGPLPIDDIFVDSRAASVVVVNHLIAHAHRRIAMVAGVGGPQRTRIDGYREALVTAGLEPLVVTEDSFTETAGLDAANTILDSGFNPTAIFAANDLMAIGVMRALRDRNLRVPEDVAVVGFDNISAAPLVTPPLTTVTQFQDRMGERAAEILIQRLRGERDGAGTALEMPFELIERASS